MHRVHRLPAILIISALLIAACAAGDLLPPTLTPSSSPQPGDTPTPASTTVPDELVWFAPNFGSEDLIQLFEQPGDWLRTRRQVDVFKFYAQSLQDFPCEICGDNMLDAFIEVAAFERLNTWGIATAVEVGAVKEWGCDGRTEASQAIEVITNVQANGGRVDFLAMDEPRLGGEHTINGSSCGLQPSEIAAATVTFVQQVRAASPGIIIGDIEPYPHYSVEELREWILLLEDSGVDLAFFHLDVDIYRVDVESQDVAADLQAVEAFCQGRGIAFGVILTSSWRLAYNDRVYYDSTLAWTHDVAAAIGAPSHVIFQSWKGPAPDGIHRFPSNLPESGEEVYSHTRLILDGLDAIRE